MAIFWVANVETDTTDNEIMEFLCEYGFPRFDTIERLPGTGRSPAVLLGFDNVGANLLRHLQPRVHAVFWKGRTLTAHVIVQHKES